MARINRIYLETSLKPHHLPLEMELSPSDSHHLQTVLRLQGLAPLRVLDQKGVEFHAQLLSTKGKRAKIRIHKVMPSKKSSGIGMDSPEIFSVIYQAPPKQRMDDIIKPLSELGTSRFNLLFSERTVVRVTRENTENWNRRLDRWRRIAREGAKQAGRKKPMEIGEPIAFLAALSEIKNLDLGFMLSPLTPADSNRVSASDLIDLLKKTLGKQGCQKPLHIGFLVGPEGGFTPSEQDQAFEVGWRPLCINPNTLRSENAASAAMAICQFMVF